MSNQAIAPRGEADFDLYPYTPSAVAGWIFVVLFAIEAVVHLIYLVWLRAWFFIPLFLGCVGEAAGYYGRAWSHDDIRNGSPYLLQLILILASAPLIAATIYMTLGRLIRALDAEKHAVIKTKWLTKIYVLIDIASLFCQVAGSAASAYSDSASDAQKALHIVMIGLGFQLFAFICFIAMIALLHVRLNRDPTTFSESPIVPWRRQFWMLYGVSVIIFVRSLYRMIEFSGGSDSALATHEAYLYVFDAFLMFLVVTGLVVVHPGQLMRVIRKLVACTLAGGEDRTFILMEGEQQQE